jgi:DNA-binding SARP family transcriptional activator
LQARFEQRVVSLSAGAGFGKTVLLSKAVAENLLAPRGVDLWLSCEEGDRDWEALATGVLRGLGVEDLDGFGSAEAAVRVIAAEVRRRSPTEVALVFDDVHVVGSATTGVELLKLLVSDLPANGHLVLCGREAPPVPLARLQAQGLASNLGQVDLAFTAEETAAFAELRDVAPGLLQQTGGWPAVAELTASMGQAGALRFLWEELLGRLPIAQRQLLAGLVAVGGGDADVAGAVCGDQSILAVLGTLPLMSQTADGWWVPHALWVAALADVLSAAAVGEARRRAAHVLADRGDFPAAMRLLLLAEAWPDVRTLIRDRSVQLAPLGGEVAQRGWYEGLPEEVRRTPEGVLLRAMSVKVSDPASSARLYKEAAAGFRDGGAVEAEVTCLIGLFQLYFWRGEDTPGAHTAERLTELAAGGSVRAMAIMQGLTALLAADLHTGLAGLDQIRVTDLGILGPALEWVKAIYLLALGRPEQAEPHARRASSLWPREACAAVIEVLRCTGRLAEAHLEADKLLAGTLGPPTTRQYAVPIALLAFTGRQDEARTHLPAARASVANAGAMHWTAAALALAEAAVAVADGDEPTARRLLQSGLSAVSVPLATLRRMHVGFAPLCYVLLPQTRQGWDAEQMEGTARRIRDMAVALFTLRESGSLEAHANLPALDPAVVRGLLPRPWLVELAVGLHALGRVDGARLLEELGPQVRSTVRTLSVGKPAVLAEAARRLLPGIPLLPGRTLEIRVLGPLEILHDGVPVSADALRRERVRQFVAYLVAEPVTTRDAVAAALWPDFDDATARNNLKVTLTYVQRLLEPDRDNNDPPYYLRAAGPRLRLWVEGLHVDSWQFEHLLDTAVVQEKRGLPSSALDCYQQALALYRGDFLVESPAIDWLDAEQRRLRARFVAAGVRGGELLLADGAHDQAHRLAVRAIHADPWSEAAHRLTIAAYLAAKDPGSARQALHRCYAMLRELGVRPQPETLMLARRFAQ